MKYILTVIAAIVFMSIPSAYADSTDSISENILSESFFSDETEIETPQPTADFPASAAVTIETIPPSEPTYSVEPEMSPEPTDSSGSTPSFEPTVPAESEQPPQTAEPNTSSSPSTMVLAVQSPLMCIDNKIINIWDRPYIYNEITYVPVRKIAEGLGAKVDYNKDTKMITVTYKGNIYTISSDDEKVNIFYDVSFLPLRDMCLYLGITINWYDGIITLADDGYILSKEQIADYKTTLEYNGYVDEYFLPRTVVNPRVVYTYEQMNEDIRILGKMYPDIIRDIHSIGKTSEGRDIPAFYLGKGPETIVMCASMHARECIATNFLMYMVDSYANAYLNDLSRDGYSFREVLDNYSFLIVPMVNPDGINIVQNGFDSAQDPDFVKSLPQNSFGAKGWKATASGVDLNNNFDLMWYEKGSGPSSEGYSGPYAASEPETLAMQNLINNTDFKIFASLHTQGQVLYWMDPNCNQELIDQHSNIISQICDEIGFTKMPSSGSIGYSGYMTDYVRYYKNTMAMTIEICPYIGDYPYPESDFDSIAYPVRNIGLILANAAEQL